MTCHEQESWRIMIYHDQILHGSVSRQSCILIMTTWTKSSEPYHKYVRYDFLHNIDKQSAQTRFHKTTLSEGVHWHFPESSSWKTTVTAKFSATLPSFIRLYKNEEWSAKSFWLFLIAGKFENFHPILYDLYWWSWTNLTVGQSVNEFNSVLAIALRASQTCSPEYSP